MPNTEEKASPLKRRPWKWVCEFCFRTSNAARLPRCWEWVWQCAVCPRCEERVLLLGGCAAVRGGAFAGRRADPRKEGV